MCVHHAGYLGVYLGASWALTGGGDRGLQVTTYARIIRAAHILQHVTTTAHESQPLTTRQQTALACLPAYMDITPLRVMQPNQS